MLQRSQKRQTGFIRCQEFRKTAQYLESRSDRRSESNECFSPFQDLSPKPIHIILRDHASKQKVKLVNNPGRSKTFCDSYSAQDSVTTSQNLQHQKRQNLSFYDQRNNSSEVAFLNESKKQHYGSFRYKNYQSNHSEKTYSNDADRYYSVVTTEEQILQITAKPELKEEPTLSECFKRKCSRLHEKLDHERRKFSKSTSQKKHRQECSMSFIVENNISFAPQNKENILKNCSPIQTKPLVTQKPAPLSKSPKVAINTTKCQKQKFSYFIKMTTTPRGEKGRSISPREAYMNSFRKWKELPQVKAKEKERQKERKMRQRMMKARQHSFEVRKRMRK